MGAATAAWPVDGGSPGETEVMGAFVAALCAACGPRRAFSLRRKQRPIALMGACGSETKGRRQQRIALMGEPAKREYSRVQQQRCEIMEDLTERERERASERERDSTAYPHCRTPSPEAHGCLARRGKRWELNHTYATTAAPNRVSATVPPVYRVCAFSLPIAWEPHRCGRRRRLAAGS